MSVVTCSSGSGYWVEEQVWWRLACHAMWYPSQPLFGSSRNTRKMSAEWHLHYTKLLIITSSLNPFTSMVWMRSSSTPAGSVNLLIPSWVLTVDICPWLPRRSICSQVVIPRNDWRSGRLGALCAPSRLSCGMVPQAMLQIIRDIAVFS